MPRSKFTFVFIPADEDLYVQEQSLDLPAIEADGNDTELVGCLTVHLRAHFQRVGATPEQRLLAKERLKERLAARVSTRSQDSEVEGEFSPAVKEKTLDIASQMCLVETVALLPGNADNGYEHVNLYIDDQGTNKGLPTNTRANGLAAACGKAVAIAGDAFVARIIDDGNAHFDRPDFKLAEMSSTAAWVMVAKKRQQQLNTVGRANVEKFSVANGNFEHIDASEFATGRMESGEAAAGGRKYSWVARDDEVIIEAVLPTGTKIKDLHVCIKVRAVEVRFAALNNLGNDVIIAGDLFGASNGSKFTSETIL